MVRDVLPEKVVLCGWDQVAEALTPKLLPEIEPVKISCNGAVVCVSHVDLAVCRTFSDAEEAEDFAHGLRAELFDAYAALADETLMTFSRQAIAARNG